MAMAICVHVAIRPHIISSDYSTSALANLIALAEPFYLVDDLSQKELE